VSKNTVSAKKVLHFVKNDATNLMERLVLHGPEGLKQLNLKRSREHFDLLFHSKYFDLSGDHLLDFNEELQICITRFYEVILELKWYFLLTEDLPLTQEDKFERELRRLRKHFDLMMNYSNYTELSVLS
jgi:hypothetical protein